MKVVRFGGGCSRGVQCAKAGARPYLGHIWNFITLRILENI
jgi:hypothetical protein